MDTVLVTSTIHLDIDNLGVTPVDMYDEYMTDLAPADGITGSGPDFYNYGALSLNGSGYFDTTYNPSDLTRFIGSYPVQLVFDGSAEFALGGETWMPFLTVSDFAASMNASLTYEYSGVPEPATLLMLSLGSVGLMRKRK